jgi:DNA-binding beta-propeller fold protein YncE
VPLGDGGALVSLPGSGQVVGVGARALPPMRTGVRPDGVAVAGDLVAVVDAAESTLSVFDAGNGRLVQQARAGDGSTHVAADRRGRLVVVDTGDGEILIYSTGPLFLRQRFPVAGAPYGVAYDDRRDVLWLTLTATNEVVGLNLSGGAPREVGRYPTVHQPDSVTVDPVSGRLYVASRIQGVVQTIGA